MRELAKAFLAQGKTVRAAALMLNLIKTEATAENLTLLADIYMQQGLSSSSLARIALSIACTRPSMGSLFITYSSTNHRTRSGISEYADRRTIGWFGNRCLIWKAMASASIPSDLYSRRIASTAQFSSFAIAADALFAATTT